MSIGTTPPLQPSSKRSVPRYKLTVPADITVLRSGVPESIPGRTLEIGEGGLGLVIACQLLLGESVRVEFLLPHTTTPVRATAVVRYQRELCCGLQFIRLPAEQQSIIRYWTRCEATLSLSDKPSAQVAAALLRAAPEPLAAFESGRPKYRFWYRVVTVTIFSVLVSAALGWWQWQQEWAELEAQIPERQTTSTKAEISVPADGMQRRVRHMIAPEYPRHAQREGVQGTVALDAVVSAEGVVTQLKYRSGPEALSAAAMDAVRWWRYEPFLVNGQPTAVQTTIAVDFRLDNSSYLGHADTLMVRQHHPSASPVSTK